jgi:hypothetical protein
MISPEMALLILNRCEANEDFHGLPSEAVRKLLDYAREARYYPPAHANGSRARYFHAYLTRRANSKKGAE